MDPNTLYFFACGVVGVAGLFFVISQSTITYFRFRSQARENSRFSIRFDRVEKKLDSINSKVEWLDKEIKIVSFEKKYPKRSQEENPHKQPPYDD